MKLWMLALTASAGFAMAFVKAPEPRPTIEVRPTPVPVSRPTPSPTPAPPVTVETKRAAILRTAQRAIGTREATGRNDGPDIERWLRLSGANKGDPWCAAFNYGVGVDAGFPVYPKTAWSPSMVSGGWRLKDYPERRVVRTSAFGIWFSTKNRVAHTGLVEEDRGSTIVTIEGNTNQAGSRDGDGVYRKYRLRSQIYSVRDWIE